MKKLEILLFSGLCLFLMGISCSDSHVETDTYDPNKPVKLTSFMPDTGRIASQVLLDGENFGNDPSKLKVYFNEKQAAVVGVKDGTAYVLTPRLPGDTCKISVVIGEDSLTYENEFYYTTSYNVSTLVGKDSRSTVTIVGDFADVEFVTNICSIHADYENAYFLSTNHTSSDLTQTTIMHIDPEAKVVRDLWPSSMKRAGNRVMATDPRTNITYSPERVTDGIFIMDPDNLYTVKRRAITHPTAEQIANEGYVNWTPPAFKHSIAFCRYDNYLYTRARSGDIIRWDPLGSNVGSLFIAGTDDTGKEFGDSFITFSPIPEESHIMYISIVQRHAIYTLDVTKPDQPIQLFCGTGSGTGGHQDGLFADAEFKNPNQISFDETGENLYVADTGNHCIRKIDLKSRLVSTVAGQPGEAGLQDGSLEEALFNGPQGVCVDREGYILIVDSNNRRVRKLAIE